MQSALKSLVFLSFLSGAALYFCPEGGCKRVLKLLSAAIFVAVILSPLQELDYDVFSLEQARFASAEAEITHKTRLTEQMLKKALLQENCANYIASNARELGLSLKDAELELRQNDADEWLPYAITIRVTGEEDAAELLCRQIRDELGIPMERQVWTLNE